MISFFMILCYFVYVTIPADYVIFGLFWYNSFNKAGNPKQLSMEKKKSAILLSLDSYKSAIDNFVRRNKKYFLLFSKVSRHIILLQYNFFVHQSNLLNKTVCFAWKMCMFSKLQPLYYYDTLRYFYVTANIKAFMLRNVKIIKACVH